MPLLAVAWMPMALVLLALVGWWRALLHPLATGAVAVSVITWFKVYEGSGHRCLYEMFRYMGFLTPAVVLLAALGWRWVAELVTGRWPGRTAGWAVPLALVAALALPSLPGLHSFYMPGQEQARVYPEVGDTGILPSWPGRLFAVDANQQREVRLLLRVREELADCTLVMRLASQRHGFNFAGDDLAIVRDGILAQRWPARDLAIVDVMRGLAEKERCVQYYHGLDCNLTDRDRCSADVAALVPSRRFAGLYGTMGPVWTFEGILYNDVDESGRHQRQVTLGVFELP